MKHLVDSVKASLKAQNYISALYLTLTLPDICGRLDYENGKKSKERYIEWFDKYLAKTYTKNIGAEGKKHVFLTGNDMYALRCAVIHEGTIDICSQKARKVHERFFFTVNHPHLRQINSVLQLDIVCFCNEVIDGVLNWLEDFKLRGHNQDILREMVAVFSEDSFSTSDI